MGGIGSGRWGNYIPKRLIGQQIKINVHKWQRQKLLTHDNFFEWDLLDGEGLHWPVTVKVTGITLEVTYELQNEEGLRELVVNSIVLGWTANRLGCRVWFVCSDCGRRVADLYLTEKFLMCRHCYRLGYESQRKLEPT